MHDPIISTRRVLLPALIALAVAGTAIAQSDPPATDPQGSPPAQTATQSPPAAPTTQNAPTPSPAPSTSPQPAATETPTAGGSTAASAPAQTSPAPSSPDSTTSTSSASSAASSSPQTPADAATSAALDAKVNQKAEKALAKSNADGEGAKKAPVMVELEPEKPAKSKPESAGATADQAEKATAKVDAASKQDKSKAGAANAKTDKTEKTVAADASKADRKGTTGAGKEASSLAKSAEDKPAPAADNPEEAAALDLKNRMVFSHDKFAQLDANQDGFVDRSEAAASSALKRNFARFDANKDGKLSPEEFAAINDLAAIKPDAGDAVRRQ